MTALLLSVVGSRVLEGKMSPTPFVVYYLYVISSMKLYRYTVLL